MIKNIKNIRLIAILVVLILVYAGLKLFKNTGRSQSFREDLVQIDTSRVTRMVIEKEGKTFDVSKGNEQNWEVSLFGGGTAQATESSVKNALGTLLRIEPSRIATRDPEKWKDYQVDTAGTNVKVYEGSKNTLDLIIGRFGVQGQRQFYTFVRLAGDDEVYAADNFMGVSFPTQPSSFRNTRFLQMETDSIQQVVFQYPADSSFILERQGEAWFIGSRQADSTQVDDYLSDLRYVTSTEFVDDVQPAALITPSFVVDIKTSDQQDQRLEAYQHPEYGYIFHSSYNPDSYFSDERLKDRIFVGMEQLLNPEED